MAAADVALPTQPTTLFYYLEPKDGGVTETYPGTVWEKTRKHVPYDSSVKDLRSIRSEFTIDKCGFQLVDHVPREREFLDEESVKELYYPEVREMIKKVSGASEVHVISHMCRRDTHAASVDAAKGKEGAEFVSIMNPARFVHVDQTYHGAEQVLYLNLPEEEADRRVKKRWGIINVWQPILKPVTRDPLAFCDFRTLDEKDFRTVHANLPPKDAGEYGKVSKNLHYKSTEARPTARYEVRNMAHNPNQKWYFASEMSTEEAWIFKIFDSKNDGRAKCAVHSSFALEGQPDYGDPRTSVEVRCFVFWDEDAE